jgi:signal transduction histidine kinase
MVFYGYKLLVIIALILFLIATYSMILIPLYKSNEEKYLALNAKYDDAVESSLQELAQQNRMLTQQSKLAIMGEMLSMIAHQWRQPLSTISTLGATMRLKIELGKDDKEYLIKSLQKIEMQTKYLSDTVSDFSNFFQPDKKKSLVYLQSIIVKSIRILSKSLEDSGIIVLEDYEIESNIEIYNNELMQVIINIIKNAQDALITNRVKNPTITIYVTENKKSQVIMIEDNAGGIPEEIIDNIFDPYFSTKGKNGTGIGLYMSKMIVEKHLEGEIKVKNAKNGAKFTIILPLQ